MRMNRRNVLVGMGALTVGGGAIFGSGAFSSVEAERTANISVADDAAAYLALEVHSSRDPDSGFVQTSGAGTGAGQLEFYFDGTDTANADGLNENSVTRFDNLLTITNNGSNDVSITVEAYDANNESTVDLGLSAYQGNDPTAAVETLTSGSSVDVGIEFDLTDATGDPATVTDIRIVAD